MDSCAFFSFPAIVYHAIKIAESVISYNKIVAQKNDIEIVSTTRRTLSLSPSGLSLVNF